MITQVQASFGLAKADALTQQLSNAEIQHIDTCTEIINEAIEELSIAVKVLPYPRPI